jgi:hypothetical protein
VTFAIALLFLFGTTAWAGSFTSAGLTFDDMGSSGFTITGGIAGTGSAASPITLFETITGTDVTIEITGLTHNFGNPANTGHSTGFWLKKVITNSTGVDWNFFDNELQEVLGTPSSDGDGLSFAQGPLNDPRPWTSDKFTKYTEIIHPRDYINFYGGTVAAGSTVTMSFVITDNSPVSPFYLRQRPNFVPPGVIPLPSAAFMGLGLLGGLALVRRVRRRK